MPMDRPLQYFKFDVCSAARAAVASVIFQYFLYKNSLFPSEGNEGKWQGKLKYRPADCWFRFRGWNLGPDRVRVPLLCVCCFAVGRNGRGSALLCTRPRPRSS